MWEKTLKYTKSDPEANGDWNIWVENTKKKNTKNTKSDPSCQPVKGRREKKKTAQVAKTKQKSD